MQYTELQVTTNFSFLRGASHPEELVAQAKLLGYPAIAVTDHNTLAGIVRAHAAAKKAGIRLIVGCRLDIADGPSLLAYPMNITGYKKLVALLTKGNRRTEKGKCLLYKADIFACAGDLKFILLAPHTLTATFTLEPAFVAAATAYKAVFGDALYIAATRYYQGDDMKLLFRIAELSALLSVRMVATNDIHYHERERRELQDVLTCIREKCTIQTAGFRLHANAERYLKEAAEMERLFRQYPSAIASTQELVCACTFSLDELRYEYPVELTTAGRTPQEELTLLAWEGARTIFGESLPEMIMRNIEYELKFIEEMNYASYFLTVYDIVRFARSKQILCQGRGSAANSTICFCLGITAVNPTKFDLLFERFISAARNEPPDIDVDFEHERREEVMQYVFEKYGRDRAAIVATVTQVHHRGAIRDVARVMGIAVDTIQRLSSAVWEFTEDTFADAHLLAQGLNPCDPYLRKTLSLTQQYIGFPRQLGQHTGGFVITNGLLSELCPILNARMKDRTCIEWNKDDIDALGFMKIDVLALGMLTCIRKAFDEAKQHYGLDLTLANIPQDDPRVYEMISHADTIGVFQIESRAQQSMLPRLRPRTFYDLVIEVAIVRPGPIQGDMVHPYLRRRNGEEPVEYPSKELEEILSKTLGVPLFQEQAMKIAIIAAGFTPAEADELRRAMATFKAKGVVERFEKKLIAGMIQNGYALEYAQRVFQQLKGFGSYGFPESHAASFALLVYISSWIKCFYPDIFACALLNSMPMGFYQPAQIVDDAVRHGVHVRPVDVNYSLWDNLLEAQNGTYKVLRLGFRQVKGLREDDMQLLLAKRGAGYTSIAAMCDAGISLAALERLSDADAFGSMGLDRRQALWEIASLKDRPVGMFTGQEADPFEDKVVLPVLSAGEQVVHDYAATALSLKAHPVSFVRERLAQLHVVPAGGLAGCTDGDYLRVAGLVLVRQRPGTASGICFMTIEDETGVANVVVFQKLFDQCRAAILQSKLIMIEGKLQKEGAVIHVIAKRCYNASKLLRTLTSDEGDNAVVHVATRGDEVVAPVAPGYPGARKQSVQQELLFPASRDFK